MMKLLDKLKFKKDTVVHGQSDIEASKSFLKERTWARNKWVIVLVPVLAVAAVGVAIYAFAATNPWSSSNAWSSWSYQTNSLAPITHSNAGSLQLKFALREKRL